VWSDVLTIGGGFVLGLVPLTINHWLTSGCSALGCAPDSNYPPEYKVRRVNRVGIIKIFGDCVYVSASLRGQLVGLQHERGMQWRAYFHEVDLGIVEIVNMNDALSVLSASESSAVNPNKGTSISTIVSI